MELKADFAKIVGTPKEGVDSWVLVEDGFFLVFELSGQAALPVTLRGKEIIDNLTNDYRNLLSKNLTNLKELVDKLKVEEGLSLSLVLGVQIGRVFYLICRGGGRVIGKRKGKFAIILSQDSSASGILEDQDIFLLTSSRFSEIVSYDEVKNTFDDLTVSELAESLTSLVHRAEDTSGVAALILQFQAKEEGWNKVQEVSSEAPARIKQSLFSIIQQLKSMTFLRSSALYLRRPQGEEEKRKRTVLFVAVILVILLLISIILGFGKRLSSQKESKFIVTINQALHQYEEGKALVGLNNLRASSLLGEAKTSLQALGKDFSKNSDEAKKITELLGKIEQELGTASQTYKITPGVFFDLGLIKEGAEGKSLRLSEDNLVVLDSKNASLYQINIKSKAGKILAGGEDLAGAKLMAVSDEAVYILTNEEILKCQMSNLKCQMTMDKDTEWGEISDLESFGSNLYLLDKGKGKIWKYLGGETGFSEKRNYLPEDYNLANAFSMAIDGSIWLTTDRILKFTQGSQDSFQIQGLEQPFGTNLLLFTSEETKNLYVLDKTNNRVVILEKTGTYKSQYILEGLGEVSEMVVSEGEKKIFLLGGGKIYEIGLK